jgi:hypothetical protein
LVICCRAEGGPELKHEIRRKSLTISRYSLVQAARFYAIEHDLLTGDEKDPLLDLDRECFTEPSRFPIARVGLASRSAASQSS